MRKLICLALLLTVWSARADDWPNWRGPHHNGVSAETDWQPKWPADGPPRLWKASIGTGFSSVTVARGRVYTMGNRAENDAIFCFDSETGKLLWKQTYRCAGDPHYYEGGPSATPTVDGNDVYTLSKAGDIYCCRADNGHVLWSKNIARELGLESPTWGFASSALVQGSLVIFNVGTLGVALDKTSGQVVWKTGPAASGYSTPVPCVFGGVPALALMTGAGADGIEAATGRKLWEFPWKANYNLNVADPIVVGDRVFISSTYAKTDALLQIQNGNAAVVWQNRNLQNQLNSSVLVDGFLYGVNGVAGPAPAASLKCIDWQTGSVKWEYPDVGGGALMVAGGNIIALSDKGELFTGAASPQGFTPISRAQVLGGRCWTVPVLANGRIYCRNAKGDLVCLDVKPH